MATRVLKLALARLSDDRQQRYRHPLAAVETFVNPAQFQGTVYKAGGWIELGLTRGCGRVGRDYYVRHNKPKRLFVRELCRNARRGLQAVHGHSTLAVNDCTLCGNVVHFDYDPPVAVGSGIMDDSGVVNIKNTIFANGTGGNLVLDDPLDAINSAGYNLCTDDGGGGLTDSTDLNNTDPKLGPLADNRPARHCPTPGQRQRYWRLRGVGC